MSREFHRNIIKKLLCRKSTTVKVRLRGDKQKKALKEYSFSASSQLPSNGRAVPVTAPDMYRAAVVKLPGTRIKKTC
jgi:hypothetical protein